MGDFRGKRAELGVYDDAAGFTQEERETYVKMLANRSFDSGLNILDDKFWIEGDDSVEFIVPPKSNGYCQEIWKVMVHNESKANC